MTKDSACCTNFYSNQNHRRKTLLIPDRVLTQSPRRIRRKSGNGIAKVIGVISRCRRLDWQSRRDANNFVSLTLSLLDKKLPLVYRPTARFYARVLEPLEIPKETSENCKRITRLIARLLLCPNKLLRDCYCRGTSISDVGEERKSRRQSSVERTGSSTCIFKFPFAFRRLRKNLSFANTDSAADTTSFCYVSSRSFAFFLLLDNAMSESRLVSPLTSGRRVLDPVPSNGFLDWTVNGIFLFWRKGFWLVWRKRHQTYHPIIIVPRDTNGDQLWHGSYRASCIGAPRRRLSWPTGRGRGHWLKDRRGPEPRDNHIPRFVFTVCPSLARSCRAWLANRPQTTLN